MKVVVNGRERELDGGATVRELVEDLGLRPERVVVERNGEALDRGRYASTPLADGDVVEVVRAVAGG